MIKWHQIISANTIADTNLYRILPQSQRTELGGEFMCERAINQTLQWQKWSKKITLLKHPVMYGK